MAVVVLKFGGTSVATVSGWQVIAERIAAVRAEGDTPLVVHSALAGVSNDLEALVTEAIRDVHHETLERIRERHDALAGTMQLEASLIDALFDHLRKLAAGIALIGEASARQRARIMALGERMASVLGHAWLTAQGVALMHLDARAQLTALTDPLASDESAFLNASCEVMPDRAAIAELTQASAGLTQGFIARRRDGDTVVLGRGGSDTSASYLAVRYAAKRIEIWTDVAGMFSADPRHVRTAHLLKQLDYAEAQEIASTGARVLHPRCIGPAREHDIPLHVRSTMAPEEPGTRITAQPGSDDARLKAVSVRRAVTLISMETSGMWQQPGFLARAFAVFAEHGLSIDLISSSQTSVTVSLDATGPVDPDVLGALTETLAPFCRVTVLGQCAAISLVGRRVRAILHQLAPALDVFREFEVHLVSQAANDLNFTFVVDEGHAEKLVHKLHDLLIHRTDDNDPVMGERGQHAGEVRVVPATAWWAERRDELLALTPQDAPVYVYSKDVLSARARDLCALPSLDRVFYACKANAHEGVLSALGSAGCDMECVSLPELQHALASVDGLTGARCLFTPNFASRREYVEALALGAQVTLDNRFVAERWRELFDGHAFMLRVDPGDGRGHHHFVRTAGKRSKFGVPLEEVEAIDALVRDAGGRIIGLHAHKGSGIVDASTWASTARTLAQAASLIASVRILNLGGGLGVPTTPSDPALQLDALDEALAQVRHDYPDYALWLEPGRYLVAEAGVLLARVTQIKRKDGITFVGINAGMHSLIRPALYGAHHHIVNLTRMDEPASECVDVVGPICESADVLGRARFLPPSQEGDVLLIADAGAYGRVMSSHYNHRPPGDEILI